MIRNAFAFAATLVAVSVGTAGAQQSKPTAAPSWPAAARSQAACTGFIADYRVPHDLVIQGGADDDSHSRARLFTQGQSILLTARPGAEITEGAEYRVVRPAAELFATHRYQGQDADLRKIGTPYQDVGQVKVTRVGDQSVVATVTLSCEPMTAGDILLPFQPRTVPQYSPAKPLDHFMPLDKNKVHGRIAASQNNYGFVVHDTVVYINFGERDGTLPGRRLRIYKASSSKTRKSADTRIETIGEAVVLSVEYHSCVAVVVSSDREIAAGDYVELE